jgi:hypothetical protein
VAQRSPLPEIVSVAVPGPTAVGLELLILLQGPSRPCVNSAMQVQGRIALERTTLIIHWLCYACGNDVHTMGKALPKVDLASMSGPVFYPIGRAKK